MATSSGSDSRENPIVRMRCGGCRCVRDMRYTTHQILDPSGKLPFTYGFFECPVCGSVRETDWRPGQDPGPYQ